MKALLVAAGILLILHLLIAVGFVAWLGASGRMDQARVRQVVDLFELTVAEERQLEAEAATLEKQTRELAAKAARLEAVADGTQTVQDRLAAEQQADALAMHRLERLRADTEALHREMARAKAMLTKQKAELEAERAAFEAFRNRQTELRQQADFQQTVAMYEQLPPDQAKQMFQQLLDSGQTQQVVDYLAAMQLRKAAKVIQAFETPAEIVQATELLELLRQQGAQPLGNAMAVGQAGGRP